MSPVSSIEAAEGSSSMNIEPRTMPLSAIESSRLGKRKSRWGDRVVQPVLHGHQGERGNSITPVVHEDELSFKRYTDFRRGRSSSTCRYNTPTFQRRHHAEWRCIVCYLWNMKGKDCCSRCGAAEGIDKVGKFIRRSETIQSTSIQPAAPKSPEFLWPPVFESNGSSYVFDPRSNMFYEPNSDFFFDCNSKLYYSNKKKAYFSLLEGDAAGIAVFQKLSDANSTDQSTSSPSNKPVAVPTVADAAKTGIAIHIRSKSLSRPRDRSKSHGRRSLSRLQGDADTPRDPRLKEQIQNVEKWNNQLTLKSTLQASREVALNVASILPHPPSSSSMPNYASLRSVLDIAKATSSDLSVEITAFPSTPSNQSTPHASSIVTTRTGQPICVLCKRKFASLDQLRRHEEESELHKTNVAKMNSEQTVNASNAPTIVKTIQYEDRAKKRRLLHADVPMMQPRRPEEIRSAEGAIAVDPERALDHQNVGNQLFQKMLAKTGALDDPNKTVSDDLCDSIKGQWRRIESMSQPRGSSRALPDEKVKGIGYV